MPAVFSKLLTRTESALNGHRHVVSGAVAALALTAYTYKILVPLLTPRNSGGRLPKTSTSTHNNANNNNQRNAISVCTQQQQQCSSRPTTTPDKRSGGKMAAILAAASIPGLNVEFLQQFMRLVAIMIPGAVCPETGLLASHTAFLIMRTFLSIYVANLEGAIVKYIVRKEPHEFSRQLLKWFAVAIPATFINSMIRYLESRIALSLRTRLVDHAHRLYFTNQSYYRVSVLDARLDNCTQRLTDDIETVANTVSHLYGQITKPLFDILIMTLALRSLVMGRSKHSNATQLLLGPAVITGVVAMSALILRLVSPRFGQLVAVEAEKKGRLRFVHARIVANAEEIAFYGGHRVEKHLLQETYRRLSQHLEHMFGIKLWFVMLEQFLMKYVWSGAGLVVVSLPILLKPAMMTSAALTPKDADDSISERTHYFTTAKNLLLTGSGAVERLMSSYKDVVELAGHTARVANMFSVLEEANLGVYRKMAAASTVNHKALAAIVPFKDGQPVASGRYIPNSSGGDDIQIESVPIVTPNFDVVCPALTLHLRQGQHLLITGPNGCGKSSLFRILSGLWPIYSGVVRGPPAGAQSIFYIPQRPYMVIGTLRDQIIYPDTGTDMINKQVTEADLRRIMKLAHLENIVERDTFYAVKDWTEILSGGEKQRMALARLFYHRPKYALLDECTSAVSIDVESEIYQTIIAMGITLLTITHRPTLWKFHTHILKFDGTGLWEFHPLSPANHLPSSKTNGEVGGGGYDATDDCDTFSD